MRRVLIFIIWLICLLILRQKVYAQSDTTSAKIPDVEISVSPENEALFQSLMQKKDERFVNMLDTINSFKKRLSIHFNLLDWTLTMPSAGLEFDLSPTKRNNQSILFFGKYNGRTSHTLQPRYNFNVMALKGEYRKYWRTGKVGKKKTHSEYIKLHVHQPDTSWQEVADSSGFIPTTRLEPYFTRFDSLLASEYNGNPGKSKLYNSYHAFRRNITSTRTIDFPRNWRAYYMGPYASFDKYCISFSKKGKQGNGISIGATMGWSIPILTRSFPHEGGLDLDLGANIGIKFVKNTNFRYIDESSCYAVTAQSKRYTLVHSPVVQELRITLVYRFRRISNKVDLSLIDDYEKRVASYEEERQKSIEKRESQIRAYENAKDSMARAAVLTADSATYWDNWHKRRLENAKRINPDTIFTHLDDTLYQKIFRNVDLRNMTPKELEKFRKSEIKEQDKKRREEKKGAKVKMSVAAEDKRQGGKK